MTAELDGNREMMMDLWLGGNICEEANPWTKDSKSMTTHRYELESLPLVLLHGVAQGLVSPRE